MENKQNSLNILLVVLVSLSLIFSVSMALSPKLNASDVEGIVDSKISELNFPTAQEIASLIEVPEVELPTASGSLDQEQLDEIRDKLYQEEIEELENDSLNAFEEKFEDDFDDELEEFLEETIEGFDLFEDLEEESDESKVEVLNLGLEDEEDKLAKVYKEFTFDYELEDSYKEYKGKVSVIGTVTFDEDDGFETEFGFSLI